MKITVYESDDFFSALCDEWLDLLVNSAADEVFVTCEWQWAWWQAYQSGRIWTLVVRDTETGRLDGIAPWFVDTQPDGTRIVRPIGCVDVTDYLEVIVRCGREQAVFTALADFLVEHADRYDEIRLCNVPEQSPSVKLLPQVFEAKGLAVDVHLQEVCPVVVLPGSWPDYVAGLDRKNRHELRRKLRRAAGLADWYIVGPEHSLAEELERFLRLMAASQEDKAEFLADPANEKFFRIMVPMMAKRGWLQLAFLTVKGEAVAAYLNFDYGGRVLVYNSGLDPDEHGHLSPGIVLLARLIEHAIEQKRKVVDFLRGDESYKYDMGGQDTNVCQVIIKG